MDLVHGPPLAEPVFHCIHVHGNRHIQNMDPGPWTTEWTRPYFQKQIVPVSVKVRLGTLYRTQTYDTQYPVPAFLGTDHYFSGGGGGG